MSPLAAPEEDADATAAPTVTVDLAATRAGRQGPAARSGGANARTAATGAGTRAPAVVPAAPASSSADSANAAGWQPRRGLALALQAVIVLTPGVVALVVSLLLGRMLPRPTTMVLAIVRLFAILGVSAATMVGARIVVRRLAPLAFLLRLSLAFPNETPKRLRTALRAPSARDLEQRLSDIDEQGIAAEPKDVAAEIVSMVAALSSHHRLTRGHSERVRAYAELIGTEIGLDEQELQKLRWAALLHDLGKITVPTEILDLKGRPDPEEWAILAGHPAASARLADSLKDWLGPWWYGIGQHHEKWDGSGYPDKLAGVDIALAGRIVALADAFETMTAVRSYKRAMSMPAAQAEVVRSAGTHFDPDVVRAFLNIGLRRLRRVAGYAAWLPLQAVAVLRQLTNLVAPVVQSPAALALATTVAANTFVPMLHTAAVVAPRAVQQIVVADDARRAASDPAFVPESPGSPGSIDVATARVAPGSSSTIVATALPVRVSTPGTTKATIPGRAAVPTTHPVASAPTTGPLPTAGTTEPVTTPTATHEATTAPTAATDGTDPPTSTEPTSEPERTTPDAASAPDTEPATTAVTTPTATPVPATTAPATTAPAPATVAPTTTAAPPTPAAPPVPTFGAATTVTITGDGRRLGVKPNVNDHGQAASCTVTILTTAVSSTAGCSPTQHLDAPRWNTTYTVRVVATSAAGSSQSDVTVTTGPKALDIDASRHWPCPGWFCGSSASGFASPSFFSSFTPHAAGTAVSLLCWTTGSTVDTRLPFSAGTEISAIWVRSNEATNPYYSVLAFPTAGETARDGLPAC